MLTVNGLDEEKCSQEDWKPNIGKKTHTWGIERGFDPENNICVVSEMSRTTCEIRNPLVSVDKQACG